MLPLLDAYAASREPLHQLLEGGRFQIDNSTNMSVCSRCGFSAHKEQGLSFVLPDYEVYEYDALEDLAGRRLAAALGDTYPLLTRLMFQQCFCVMASAANPWQQHIKNSEVNGPVPPIRELIRVANSLALPRRRAIRTATP